MIIVAAIVTLWFTGVCIFSVYLQKKKEREEADAIKLVNESSIDVNAPKKVKK